MAVAMNAELESNVIGISLLLQLTKNDNDYRNSFSWHSEQPRDRLERACVSMGQTWSSWPQQNERCDLSDEQVEEIHMITSRTLISSTLHPSMHANSPPLILQCRHKRSIAFDASIGALSSTRR